MAGLLDLFGNADDAQRAGLLMLAAAGPRAQPASFGQRLLESVQQFDAQKQAQKDRAAQEEERQQRAAMQSMQMQQMQQAMADRVAQQQAAQEAAARRGGYLDSINPSAGPARPFNPAAALQAGLRPEEMKVLGPQEQENPFSKIDPKDYTPESVSQFARTRDFTQLRKLDKPETKPEILRVLAEAFGEGSPQYKAALTQYAQKATTHQPPVQIASYGSPVAVQLPDGTMALAQPGNREGAPPQIMRLPGSNEPLRPQPPKLGEAQTKQIAGIDSLGSAVDEYVKRLGSWSKFDMVNPNRRAEMGTAYNNMMLQAKEAYNLGVLNGPDYQILQSVVKDPTTLAAAVVSNDTLSGQATTLKRLMEKTKQSIVGAKANATQPVGGQIQPGHVESGYRYKGGDPANSANWEKL